MITKFGSLFAGHVDFEETGFDAPPVNERRLSDEKLAGVFDKRDQLSEPGDLGSCQQGRELLFVERFGRDVNTIISFVAACGLIEPHVDAAFLQEIDITKHGSTTAPEDFRQVVGVGCFAGLENPHHPQCAFWPHRFHIGIQPLVGSGLVDNTLISIW